MSVGILLITHPGIGNAILSGARRIVADCPLRAKCLEVPIDAPIDKVTSQAGEMARSLDQGDGVLILTDIFGATPNNIARGLEDGEHVRVLAGLSLPMLVRLFNYPDEDLLQLCATAATGAKRGIGPCNGD